MRIAITTLIATLALVTHAFAANPEQGTVTLTVPGIFHLQFNSGNGNASFSPTEVQIETAGSFIQSAVVGVLGMSSNYNGTKLYVSRTDWVPVGNPASDGEFTLTVRRHISMGNIQFVTVPNGPPVQIGDWPNGMANATYNLNYRLSDYTVADDPDTYNATVTFTLTHP
jgi:hypothetical protein